MKFGDKGVQEAIAHFIEEARLCASTRRADGVLGFAAMSTIFSCMLAVGEALALAQSKRKEDAYDIFYDEMADYSWFLPPEGITRSREAAIEKLRYIRNGLAHTLMMPPEVMLLPNRAADKAHKDKFGEAHLKRWRLIVPDFIGAVERTVNQVSSKYAHVDWDPVGQQRGWPRDPVSTLSASDPSTEEETSAGSPVYVLTSGSTP